MRKEKPPNIPSIRPPSWHWTAGWAHCPMMGMEMWIVVAQRSPPKYGLGARGFLDFFRFVKR